MIEDAKASKQVVCQRLAVCPDFQTVTWPPFSVNAATIQLLKAINQPILLLFKYLWISTGG